MLNCSKLDISLLQIWTAQKMIQQVGVTLPKSKPEPPLLPLGKKVKTHKHVGKRSKSIFSPSQSKACLTFESIAWQALSNRQIPYKALKKLKHIKTEASAGGTGAKPNDFPKCISVSACILSNVSGRI